MNKRIKFLIIFLSFFIIFSCYYFYNEKFIFKTYSLDKETKQKSLKNKNKKQNVYKVQEDIDENNIIKLDDNEKQLPIIKVYITGEVNKPGVYAVEENSRIEDIIKLAEGTTKDADLENINLALLISDEEHIVVPKKTENNKENKLNDKENNKELNIKNNDILNIKKQSNIININTATLEELKTLNGIGEIIGKNIIEYREKNGKFKKIEDIKNIKRIGECTFKKIKDNICVK